MKRRSVLVGLGLMVLGWGSVLSVARPKLTFKKPTPEQQARARGLVLEWLSVRDRLYRGENLASLSRRDRDQINFDVLEREFNSDKARHEAGWKGYKYVEPSPVKQFNFDAVTIDGLRFKVETSYQWGTSKNEPLIEAGQEFYFFTFDSSVQTIVYIEGQMFGTGKYEEGVYRLGRS